MVILIETKSINYKCLHMRSRTCRGSSRGAPRSFLKAGDLSREAETQGASRLRTMSRGSQPSHSGSHLVACSALRATSPCVTLSLSLGPLVSQRDYFTEINSGSEAGSYLRLIDFVCLEMGTSSLLGTECNVSLCDALAVLGAIGVPS